MFSASYRRKLGDNCKKARWLAGLTMAQLAEKRGIERRNIQELETGKDDVKLSTLCDHAQALNVPVGALTMDNREATNRVLDLMQTAKAPPTGRPPKPRRSRPK